MNICTRQKLVSLIQTNLDTYRIYTCILICLLSLSEAKRDLENIFLHKLLIEILFVFLDIGPLSFERDVFFQDIGIIHIMIDWTWVKPISHMGDKQIINVELGEDCHVGILYCCLRAFSPLI